MIEPSTNHFANSNDYDDRHGASRQGFERLFLGSLVVATLACMVQAVTWMAWNHAPRSASTIPFQEIHWILRVMACATIMTIVGLGMKLLEESSMSIAWIPVLGFLGYWLALPLSRWSGLEVEHCFGVMLVQNMFGWTVARLRVCRKRKQSFWQTSSGELVWISAMVAMACTCIRVGSLPPFGYFLSASVCLACVPWSLLAVPRTLQQNPSLGSFVCFLAMVGLGWMEQAWVAEYGMGVLPILVLLVVIATHFLIRSWVEAVVAIGASLDAGTKIVRIRTI